MKKNKPKFTIITVVFNDETNIEKTILSVIKQNYPNFEYIIIDGASTDRTLEIVNKYKNKIDKIVSEKDAGIYDAMNEGIKFASGRIINFLNSGDRFVHNNVLKQISKVFKNENNKFVVSRARIVDENNKAFKAINKPLVSDLSITRFKSICHQAVFYNKNLHTEYGLYNTEYKYLADTDFFLKLFNNKIRYSTIDIITVDFLYGGSCSSPQAVLERKKIYDKFWGKSIQNNLLSLKYLLIKNKLGMLLYKQYLKFKEFFKC